MILLTLEKVQLEVTKKQLRSGELRKRSVFKFYHTQSTIVISVYLSFTASEALW